MSKTIQQKIDEGRQYRNFTNFEVREEQDQEQSYIVRGYATTFNQPYVMGAFDEYVFEEQVDSRAFDECDMSDVIFQYDHQGRVFARLSNGTLSLEPDERGLSIVADLGGTEEGRKLYEEIKGGYTTKMSFGFSVDDYKEDRSQDEEGIFHELRTITKIGKLYDVSAVSLPANDATEISAKRTLDGAIERIKTERKKKADIRKRKLKLRMEMEVM